MSSTTWTRSKLTASMAISYWAWLPELVLHLIILKLPCLPECVRFASVCSTWRKAARNTGRGGEKHFPVPMLLFPTINRSGIDKLVLYCVQEKRTYSIHFPLLRYHSARFCGYSLGWLATTETDMSIVLWKPSPKERPQPVFRFPPIMDAFDMPIGLAPRTPFKVMLSADPLQSYHYVVVAIYGQLNKLAIWRSWHSTWTLSNRSFSMVYDVVWLNDILYAVNYHSQFLRIEGVWSGNLLTPKFLCLLKTTAGQHNNLFNLGKGKFMVIRSYVLRSRVIKVDELEVVDNDNDEGLVNREVTDIGGNTYFIGDQSCAVVSASENNSDIKNCICYTNDTIRDCKHNPDAVPNDVCIFSLESGIPQTHYRPDPSCFHMYPTVNTTPRFEDVSDDWPPIWITPGLSDEWI